MKNWKILIIVDELILFSWIDRRIFVIYSYKLECFASSKIHLLAAV